jgi:hypothetical protein
LHLVKDEATGKDKLLVDLGQNDLQTGARGYESAILRLVSDQMKENPNIDSAYLGVCAYDCIYDEGELFDDVSSLYANDHKMYHDIAMRDINFKYNRANGNGGAYRFKGLLLDEQALANAKNFPAVKSNGRGNNATPPRGMQNKR